jgi:hypothetical protein
MTKTGLAHKIPDSPRTLTSVTYHPHCIWDDALILKAARGKTRIPAAMLGADFDRGFIPARMMDVALRIFVSGQAIPRSFGTIAGSSSA